MEWSVDITNDPDRDYDLYMEIMRGDDYWGRIVRDKDGRLVLKVYADEGDPVPLSWLQELCRQAESELEARTDE